MLHLKAVDDRVWQRLGQRQFNGNAMALEVPRIHRQSITDELVDVRRANVAGRILIEVARTADHVNCAVNIVQNILNNA